MSAGSGTSIVAKTTDLPVVTNKLPIKFGSRILTFSEVGAVYNARVSLALGKCYDAVLFHIVNPDVFGLSVGVVVEGAIIVAMVG
jgi:hypothetical protein